MNHSSKYINSGLDWALTTKAKKLLDDLLNAGFDYDLAYAILEDGLTEKSMYSLPTEDQG